MMKANIDRRGRIARGITGTLCIATGVAMWWLGLPEATAWRWTLVILCVAAGLFQLFEACCAWCVMRACGFRTPM